MKFTEAELERQRIANARHELEQARQEAHTFQEICDRVCRFLPEGWTLTVEMERGWGGVSLFREDGDRVDYGECPDVSLEDNIETAILKAIELAPSRNLQQF